MLFNSLHFLIFFPIVVFLYFSLPYKYRWVLLLAASYYFYMCWKAEYIFLIIISTLIDFFVGIQMGKELSISKKRFFLILSLFVNLGLLFSFKYFNFFNDSARAFFNHYNIFYNVPTFNVLLPVGISFYTFQTLSYTIDIYRGKKEPEKHFGIFALYVAFFPQLVAGPIERSTSLLPQFLKKHDFDYKRITDGLKLILWGFFKKLVIADRLAILVNQVYNNPTEYNGVFLIFATYFFAFQIYCDFSAYSDIAIGSAQIMGIRLMDNFKRPYFSKSISEFWKRWHISLSTWFRDYLYISLGGNRVTRWRWYYNLIIVFLISGLWHGANWTFLIWGALHGTYILMSIWTAGLRKKITYFIGIEKLPTMHKYLKIFITFHLVLFAWIFFRANSLSDAVYIVSNLLSDIWFVIKNVTELGSGKGILGSFDLGLDISGIIIAILSILLMQFVHVLQRRKGIRFRLAEKPIWFRWAIYYVLIFGIVSFGVFNQTQFIYFQF